MAPSGRRSTAALAAWSLSASAALIVVLLECSIVLALVVLSTRVGAPPDGSRVYSDHLRVLVVTTHICTTHQRSITSPPWRGFLPRLLLCDYQSDATLIKFFFFFLIIGPPPRSPLFPSTPLFR